MGEIPVHDPPGRDVHDDEDVHTLEDGCHDHEEVADQYRAGVVAKNVARGRQRRWSRS